MKTRKDKTQLTMTEVVAVLLIVELAGIAAQAETCMNQDLFLYVAPRKEGAKPARTAARSGEKTAGAGIAVLGTKDPKDMKNPSNRSKASNERGEERQKLAGRN